MSRSVQDDSQYVFNFSRSYLHDDVEAHSVPIDCDRTSGVVVRFVDAKTRAARNDALRRVEANGIFKISSGRSNS